MDDTKLLYAVMTAIRVVISMRFATKYGWKAYWLLLLYELAIAITPEIQV